MATGSPPERGAAGCRGRGLWSEEAGQESAPPPLASPVVSPLPVSRSPGSVSRRDRMHGPQHGTGSLDVEISDCSLPRSLNVRTSLLFLGCPHGRLSLLQQSQAVPSANGTGGGAAPWSQDRGVCRAAPGRAWAVASARHCAASLPHAAGERPAPWRSGAGDRHLRMEVLRDTHHRLR